MIDRRTLIAAAGGLGAVASARAAEQPVAPAAAPNGPPVTNSLVRFAVELRGEDLPAPVVAATKRYLLDTLGCGVAGWRSDKGRIAVKTMAAMGGAPQARILGSRQKVGDAAAAFANAELVNGLDYDAIPHIPPFVVPPVLAAAENAHASGRDLIAATVVAHEIAARLGSAGGAGSPGNDLAVMGINNESIMGAAAGVSRLLGLGAEQTTHAVALAAAACPPQSSHDWEMQSPMSMVKYTPAGPIAQGACTSALLAANGFTGAGAVLDRAEGFPLFFGWRNWKPQLATAGLGEVWRIVPVDFKPYACCRFIHSRLDALVAILNKHGVQPTQIRSIRSLGVDLPANIDKMNVRTQPDAQFSTPYMLALAALRIPIDARCQDPERIKDPAVRAMMQRIEVLTHPEAVSSKRADPRSYIARTELTTTDGRTLVEETRFASGTASVGLAMSDDALLAKFLDNARERLSAGAARRAADAILSLERMDDVSRLTQLLTA